MKNIIIKNNIKINKAIDYIKSTNFSELKDGRIELGDGVWANLQTYLTKENALFEAHRRYIDVQYIISGVEKIGVCDYKTCSEEIPYDEENDIEFLKSNSDNYVFMEQNDFLILYPSDAHKPSISINEPIQVRKLVIKVPV